MAKGTVVSFIVDVISKNAGKAKQGIDDLAKSTNKVANANNAADKSAREHFDTQAKGVIGTANSTKSFSKLAQTVGGGGSSSVVGAYATLAANVFALTAAFGALRQAAQVEQITQGLEALGSRTGRTLSIAAEDLRKVTGNAISAEQAMRSTAQVISAGFNSTQLERLGNVATDASFALGRNMTDSIDRLTRGVIKLEPELLDELGIMTRLDEATQAYAIQLGKRASALTQTEKRQAFFNAVMAEGELKFQGLSKAAGNSKAYDQLSASLNDLTKQGLNLLNTALLPIAGIFSNSPTALLGGMVLFASSIRKQLLPGLSDLSVKIAGVAEEMRKITAEEINDIIKFNPDTNSSALTALQGKIATGTAGLKDYQDAQAKVNVEMGRFQKTIDKFEGRGIDSSGKQFQNYKKNLEVIGELKEEYKELNEVIQSYHAADARAAGANSIVAAGNGKIRDSFVELKSAMGSYRAEQIMAQKTQQTTATGMTQLRTAAFGASIGVKALGAAFLNAIPIIGQVIFAIGLLVAGYKAVKNALTTKEQKAYAETMKELTIILKTLDEKSREYARTLSSTAPAFQRQAQAMGAVSNIASELNDKLAEANRLQNKAASSPGKTANFYEQLTLEIAQAGGNAATALGIMGNEAITKWWTGIEKGSKFIDFRGLSQEVTGSAGFKTFKELFESDIPLIQRTAQRSMGKLSLEDIRAKPAAEQLKIFNKMALETTDRLREIGPANEAVAQSFKDAETAAGGFIEALGVTTSYDKMVDGLNNINSALIQQAAVAAKAGLSMDDYAATLTGVGANMSKFLSKSSQKALQNYRINDQVAQTIDAIPEKDRTDQQRLQLFQAKASLAVQRSKMASVGDELTALQNMFKQAQIAERLGKRQLDLEQARLKAVSSLYEVTSAGLKAQYEGEERIRGLQEQSINRTREVNALVLKNNTLTAREAAELATLEARKRELENAAYNGPDRFVEKDLKRLRELQSIQESAAEARANEVASVTELAVIDQSRLTIAQQQAAYAERDAALKASSLKFDRDARNSISEILDLETQLTRARSGRATLATDEVRQLIEVNRQKRLSLDADYEASRLQIRAKIDTAKATASRAGLTDAERAAGQSQVNRYEIELRQAEITRDIGKNRIAVEEKLQVLQKANFDARDEGLNWQKESLSLLEKEADLRQEILSQENKRVETEARLALRRRGLEATPEAEASIAINAAIKEYDLAVQGAKLKRSMIDLEFALLDGQRSILREQLAAKKEILLASNISDNDPRIKMLDQAMKNLDDFDVAPVRDMAKRVVDETLRASRAELESLIDPSKALNTPVNAMRSFFDGMGKQTIAMEAGRASLSQRVDDVGAVATETATTITESISSGLQSAVDPIVVPLNSIVTKLDSIADDLTTIVSNNSSALGSASTPQQAIVAIGKMLQERGIRVSEQSQFGGNTGGHKGAGHREDRAIDVNIGTGNREWDNPVMKARFDALKIELEGLGAKVLWGVAGHFDHLHAEFPKNFTRVVEAVNAVERATAEIAQPTVQQAAPETPYQVDDIVVVGPSRIKESTDTLASSKRSMTEYLDTTEKYINQYRTSLESLGSQGQLVMGVADGATLMARTINTELSTILDSTESSSNRFLASAAVASAAIQSISTIVAASSNAKVEALDKEIAAEQKRDGKSAESVAKIAALEAKKDQTARKAFETSKKLQMAQAAISTASAVVGALGAPPVPGSPFNVAMAKMMGALGAAQMAIIAGTSYQSSASSASAIPAIPSMSIGKRGDSVDLAKNNSNAGGEIGYLRGASGYGSNASNYSVIGSAYGGEMGRGYGNRAFVVGEHGPELMTPETPMSVRPLDQVAGNNTPQSVSFNIQALDASGVEEILTGQRGNIIKMLREAANANGQTFLEDVNVNVYTKPNVSKL